jgi:hippurate hydrolase
MPLNRYPLNVNDLVASKRVVEALRRYLSPERVGQTGPAPASEELARSVPNGNTPSAFWFVGGTDPDTYATARESGRIDDLPVNHSPLFAPVIHPTLQTDVGTRVVAAQGWFSSQPTVD